jgi:hypothetical protein
LVYPQNDGGPIEDTEEKTTKSPNIEKKEKPVVEKKRRKPKQEV